MSSLPWGDWLGRGWLLLLAFTLGCVVVLVLRYPVRRGFGAQRAFQLWLLPPVAMLASQLPHAAHGVAARLPAAVFVVTGAVNGWGAGAPSAGDLPWSTLLGLLWIVGAVVQLVRLAGAQWRYRVRLRDAVPLSGLALPWPVLRATRPDLGPALVGWWRPTIVLPVDFDRRYDWAERALVLAHETWHARRRDGGWALLARLLATFFWFHPLAWWALAALRQDQELACDAAVLGQHGALRRTYAGALLKTQAIAADLPVGCAWSSRHPLTERIAMLKHPLPGTRRRYAGLLASAVVLTAVAGTVYAASAPSVPAATGTSSGRGEYQLDLSIAVTGRGEHGEHAEQVRLALCMAPGEPGSVQTHGWEYQARTSPAGGQRMHIEVSARPAGSDRPLARLPLEGTLDQPSHGEAATSDGARRLLVDVTPHAGCPSRAASGSTAMVSEHVNGATARAVATAVAAKAGWVLVNPQALGDGRIKLDFQSIPADRAMWLVADTVGMKPVFDGRQVRFEAK